MYLLRKYSILSTFRYQSAKISCPRIGIWQSAKISCLRKFPVLQYTCSRINCNWTGAFLYFTLIIIIIIKFNSIWKALTTLTFYSLNLTSDFWNDVNLNNFKQHCIHEWCPIHPFMISHLCSQSCSEQKQYLKNSEFYLYFIWCSASFQNKYLLVCSVLCFDNGFMQV